MAALNRNYLPAFALLPAIITIALAFIRMSIALTSAREAQSERVLARHDELTGLANRRSFIAELEELVPNEGTVLLMDLDGFKSVNDKLGHLGGDELLRQIAIRFSRVIPHDALLARLGGDEFGVVIHGPPRIGLEVAHALQSTLGYPFLVEGSEIGMDIRVLARGGPRAGSAGVEITCLTLGTNPFNLFDDEINSIKISGFFIIKYWATIPCMVFIRFAIGEIWFSIITWVISFISETEFNNLVIFRAMVIILVFPAVIDIFWAIFSKHFFSKKAER
jgi:diguanylate cyclase (GGDEF)-like protein